MKTQDEVVDRLRASKQRSDEEDYRDGQASGRAWAGDQAEARELEHLEALLAELDTQPDGRELFFDDDDISSAYSAGERLFFQIDPGQDGVRDAATEFWETILGDTGGEQMAYRAAFVRGFAEGAVALWQEVKNQL